MSYLTLKGISERGLLIASIVLGAIALGIIAAEVVRWVIDWLLRYGTSP
jgi:hypothetical protein